MTDSLVSLFRSLHRRRIFQAGILYLGGAWALLEATDFFVQNYSLSHKLLDVLILLLLLGFPAVLVIAWYHGEQGRQEVVRSELAILTTLFVLAGIGTYRISTGEESVGGPDADGSVSAVAVDLGAGSVAVLPFTNSTGVDSLDWLGPGVSDILTSNLAQLAGVSVVSPQRLFDLLVREGREETDRIPDRFAIEIASRSGARLMARGSVLGRIGDLTLDAQLIDLADGTLVGVGRARGDDLFALADTVADILADQVTEHVRSGATPAPAEVAERSPLALGDLERYREYLTELRNRWRELDPGDAKGRFELVEMYGLMPGREAEQRALLREILALRPDTAAAYQQLAELAIKQRDAAAADSLLARYEGLAGEGALVALSVGHLLEEAGRVDQAREKYRQAISGPAAVSALDRLASSYMQQNRPEEGRRELERFTASADPVVRSQAELLIADTYVWEGRFSESLTRYEEARTAGGGPLPPSQEEVVLTAAGEVEELLSDPRPPLLNRSVWRLLEVGRGQRALDLIDASEFVHLNESARVPPARYHALLYARGNALELLGRRDEALGAYEEILRHWGRNVAAVPMMADLGDRISSLRRTDSG